MTVGSFLCLCPPKAVKLYESNALRRPENEDRIRSALESMDFGVKQKLVICLPGGGVAAQGTGSCPEVAVVGPMISVLSGTIQNYAYLVRKYFVTELGLPKNVSLEDIRQTTPIRDAALLCRLYERLGTGMLAKLRGRFAFCVYDSTTVRVLAARDPSGCVDLVQGQTEEGDLFVASGLVRPEGARDVEDILPGRYKYGWRASPRKYANPQDVVEDRAAAATTAAAAALTGLVHSARTTRRNKSAARDPGDGAVCGIPKFRTKAEMREWSAAVARDAIERYEAGLADGRKMRPGAHFGSRFDSGQQPKAPERESDDEKSGLSGRAGLSGRDFSSTDGSATDFDASEESCLTGIGTASDGQSPVRYSPDYDAEPYSSSPWDGKMGMTVNATRFVATSDANSCESSQTDGPCCPTLEKAGEISDLVERMALGGAQIG